VQQDVEEDPEDEMRKVERIVLGLMNETKGEEWTEVTASQVKATFRVIEGGILQLRGEVHCVRSVNEVASAVIDSKWHVTWDPCLHDVRTVLKLKSAEIRDYTYFISGEKTRFSLMLGYSRSVKCDGSFCLFWKSSIKQMQRVIVVLASGMTFEELDNGCRCTFVLQLQGSEEEKLLSIGLEFFEAFCRRAWHPNATTVIEAYFGPEFSLAPSFF